MRNITLTKTGTLRKSYLPAVYFDSSVLIEYWETEGMEVPETKLEKAIKTKIEPEKQAIRDILKSERKIERMVKIRRKLLERVKVTPIISPLALLQVDIVNFRLSIAEVWKERILYAHSQLGLADIIHILLAKHLGCQYIASFDSDFKRVKGMLAAQTKMSVLTSSEEILDILSG